MTRDLGALPDGLLPQDLARVHVDGGQGAVRRVGDGQPVHRQRPRRGAVYGVVRHRGFRVGGGDPEQAGLLGRLHEQDRVRGIHRHPAPVAAAQDARHGDRALHGRRLVEGTEAVAGSQLLRAPPQLGREADEVVAGEPLTREGGRPGGEGLGRGGDLPGHVARRDRALLDGPHRLAGLAVEGVDEPGLARHRHRVDHPPVHRHGEQHRRPRQVEVPQPVVNRLEVPRELARAGVQRHQRLRVEVVAQAVPAVVVVGRRADSRIHEPPFLVHDHRRPGIGVPGVVPAAILPGLVSGLARLRDEVERPHQLAGVHVEGLHVARRVARVDEAVPHPVADDHQVLEDHGRRRLRVVQAVGGPEQLLGEVDLAPVAERLHRLARGGVERDQAPARVEEDAPLVRPAPHGHPAVHEAGPVGRLPPLHGARIVLPVRLPGAPVQRDDAVVRRREEEGVVEGQRRGLEVARPHVLPADRRLRSGNHPLTRLPAPRQLEVAHVPGRDLVERRVLRSPRVAAVRDPVPVAGRLGRGRGVGAGGKQNENEAGAEQVEPEARATQGLGDVRLPGRQSLGTQSGVGMSHGGGWLE